MTIRVLLVDDEEDALDLLEILLKQIDGVTIVGRYTDPVQLMDALDALPVDVIFLDIQMPVMRGTEAARKIKLMSPHPHIIFTTAYSDYAVEAFEIQAADYLLKPIAIERLRHSVSRIQQVVSEQQVRPAPEQNVLIQCLGGFHIYLPAVGNRPLHWRTNKVKELCAFLIYHAGKPVESALIIEAIWQEYDMEKARTYLYACLSYLRKCLQEIGSHMEVVKAGKGFVLLMDGVKSDVAEFDKLLAELLSEEIVDERGYDAMNALYAGDYMEGCDYCWALARQLEIKAKYVRALRKYYEYFRRNDNSTLATDSLLRILAITPDSEQNGRDLMRLYMQLGKRNDALYVYKQMERALSRDLGVAVEAETVRLYDQIRAFK